MKKPKKITIKFFLNKNLNPIEQEDGSYYPLYTQITYDRKNTQIKCAYGFFYKSLQQAQEQESDLLIFEEKVLKKSVDYELSIHGDEFKLRGLGKKYENYCISIHALFNSYLKIRFKEILKDARPKKFLEVLNLDRGKIDFFTIYEASERLFQNLAEVIEEEFREEVSIYQVYFSLYEKSLKDDKYQFPVVIDWLEGSHQRDLDEKLKKKLPENPEMRTKSMNLINKIVSTKLELV